MLFPLILKNLKMKFSTLAALMGTTAAVQINQSATDEAKTEPSYEITGTMRLKGADHEYHHNGTSGSEDMAEHDAQVPTISAASVHNPLQNIEMLHQNFAVGGQLDLILNEGGEIGRNFDINLIQDDKNMVKFDIRGHEWEDCLVINEMIEGTWGAEMRYCAHWEWFWDDVMWDGPEIQLQFLENGVAMRFWGHHINQEFQDMLTITGRPAGPNTWNTHLNYDKLNKVTVNHLNGAYITEAAMS